MATPKITGIFGVGRNGTTLLMGLLDGSPDLWVHPMNFDYLSTLNDLLWIRRVRRSTAQTATTRRLRYLHRPASTELLIKGFASQLQQLEESYLQKLVEPMALRADPLVAVRARDRYSAREYFFVFLEAVRAACDDRGPFPKPHYVFKSAEGAYVEEYCRVFPEMRFIHIMRHPFSNFSSVKRSQMAHKENPFWYMGGDILRTFLEKRWVPHARFVASHAEERARHFVVKYEELCERPLQIMGEICDWLKVRPPADPTLQTFLAGKAMAELPVLPSKKGVVTPQRVVADMAAAYKYDEVLTEREREFILCRTFQLGARLGYFPGGDARTLPDRWALARKWLWPDFWELKNAQGRIRLLTALARRRLYIYGRLLMGTA